MRRTVGSGGGHDFCAHVCVRVEGRDRIQQLSGTRSPEDHFCLRGDQMFLEDRILVKTNQWTVNQ